LRYPAPVPGHDAVHARPADARLRRRGRARTAQGPARATLVTEFDELVRARHSTRLFLRDKPVPRELLDEALELAMRAPSNSNIQPWRAVVASGPRRDRLAAAPLPGAAPAVPLRPSTPERYPPLRPARPAPRHRSAW